MRRELRCKLEREVKEFQDNLQRDEDSAYFRQLEADRLRGKFQLASQSALYWRKKKQWCPDVLTGEGIFGGYLNVDLEHWEESLPNGFVKLWFVSMK